MSHEHLCSRSRLASRVGIACCFAALRVFAADPEPASAAALPPAIERTPQVTPAPAPAPAPAPPELTEYAALNPSGMAAGAGTAPAPSQNVTINLINRLVERGVLTKQDSTDLIRLAEEDAAVARTQAATTEHDLAALREFAASQTNPVEEDAVRVTYIPENVKAQMREQIRNEVMEQARTEGWAAPRMVPEWVSRFSFSGDVRVRYEGIYYPDGNDNSGAFPNFNSINTGAPFDVAGSLFSPQYNVDQDRERVRIRARFGIGVDLGEGFSAGMRIATGENNSPVTTNQSLGLAGNGQGGDFSKYAIWLDRAFLKWQWGGKPEKDFTITFGRFESPFQDTGIVWDDDLNFDGVAIAAKYEVFPGVRPFIAGGAFPVFNTDLNFSSNRPDKFESDDKWLYGGQLGTDWKITKKINLKLAGAYYYFDNVKGRLSDPYTPLNSSDAGNTDGTRPSFAQKGNSYRPLRNIVANANNNFGTTNQFQYFGLATGFEVLSVYGRLDFDVFEPFRISLIGEYVKNLAFDKDAIDAIAVNNRGPNDSLGQVGRFDGGDTAWSVDLRLGRPALEKLWDWNLYVGYRHVESDAVIDGFTDSDFGLGGTNMKGYTVGGSLALSKRVALSLRWMSAEQIAGPPLKNDIVQLDLNGKF